MSRDEARKVNGENPVVIDINEVASNLSVLLKQLEQSQKNNGFKENWIESGRLIRIIAVPVSLVFALERLFADPKNKNRNIFIFMFSLFTYLTRAAILFCSPIFLSKALESIVNDLANKKERNQNDIIQLTVALFFMLPVNYFFTHARSFEWFEPLAKKDFKAALMRGVCEHNNRLSLDAQVDEPKEVMTEMFVRANDASFVIPAFSGLLSGIVASSALLAAIFRLSTSTLKDLEIGKLFLFTSFLFYNSYRSQQKLVKELNEGLSTIIFVRAKADENKSIQLNGMEEFESAQAAKVINRYCERTRAAEYQDAMNKIRVWGTVGVFSCAMVGYLLQQYTERKFNFSQVIQLKFYLILQAFELSTLSMQADKLATTLTIFSSVNGYSHSPVKKLNRNDAVVLTLSAAPSIEFNNVSFDYYRDLKIHCINSNDASDHNNKIADIYNGQAIFLIYDIKTHGYLVGFAKSKGDGKFNLVLEKLSMDANIEIGIYFSKIKGQLDDRSPFFGFILRLLLPVIQVNDGVIPKKHLIENLSFKVAAGKRTVIVGSSGCGKSTLISLLSRFYDPVSGAIKINDMPIQNFTVESLRKLTAVISQDTKPFDATVRENILYGNGDTKINEPLMEFVGLPALFCDRRAGQRSGLLSGGQGQRINVLHALHKPGTHIVLADEPTTYLDDKTAKSVQQAMNRECAGKTVLQVAHNMLVTFCDELEKIHLAQETCVVCFCHDGKIETGTVYDLIRNLDSEFSKLVRISCAESDTSFDDITRNLLPDRSASHSPFSINTH